MTATIPKKEPESFTQGDTFKFTRSFPDYLPTEWTLTYSIVNAQRNISVTATDNGDGTHLINEAAATTDDWPPGNYHWQAYVTKAAERYSVGSGALEICANFANADNGHDGRSFAQCMLDGLKEAMETGADRTVITYSVSGGAGSRSRTFESSEDIRRGYSYWRQQVAKERAYRRVLTVF